GAPPRSHFVLQRDGRRDHSLGGLFYQPILRGAARAPSPAHAARHVVNLLLHSATGTSAQS
ncbi:MAG TPA: hypothetical protein VMC85_15935, partial [Desulfomonilaceae bacterium]|nr:hypothetical protein [Desulfomonilaceae bacterium]